MDATTKLDGSPRKFPSWLLGVAALICSFSASLAAFWSPGASRSFFVSLLGIAVVLALLIYPEIALALYAVVGDLKGDDRIAALLPMDLTLALGAVLLAGIALS